MRQIDTEERWWATVRDPRSYTLNLCSRARRTSRSNYTTEGVSPVLMAGEWLDCIFQLRTGGATSLASLDQF